MRRSVAGVILVLGASLGVACSNDEKEASGCGVERVPEIYVNPDVIAEDEFKYGLEIGESINGLKIIKPVYGDRKGLILTAKDINSPEVIAVVRDPGVIVQEENGTILHHYYSVTGAWGWPYMGELLVNEANGRVAHVISEPYTTPYPAEFLFNMYCNDTGENLALRIRQGLTLGEIEIAYITRHPQDTTSSGIDMIPLAPPS